MLVASPAHRRPPLPAPAPRRAGSPSRSRRISTCRRRQTLCRDLQTSRQCRDQTSSRCKTPPASTKAAYGELLAVHGPDAVAVPSTPRLTSLGYSGEHFDARAQQQYLRARWYDPSSGRFNRLDPFAGNMPDPQSLHKYAYVHGDPVGNIDPTGEFSLAGFVGTIGIGAAIGGLGGAGYGAAYASANGLEGNAFWNQVGQSAFAGALIGGAVAGGGYGLAWGLSGEGVGVLGTASALRVGHGLVGFHASVLGFGFSLAQFQDASERGDNVDRNFATIGMAGAVVGGLFSGRAFLTGQRGHIAVLEFGSKATTADRTAVAARTLGDFLESQSTRQLMRGDSSNPTGLRKWSIAFDAADPSVFAIKPSGPTPSSVHPDARVLFEAQGPVGCRTSAGTYLASCAEGRSANTLLHMGVPKQRVKLITVTVEGELAAPCANCGTLHGNSIVNQHVQNRIDGQR